MGADAAVELVDSPAAFSDLVDRLVTTPEYAIDTEFHRERSYVPHLALVQVAWPGSLALVDPLAVDVSGLSRLFSAPAVAVVHAADQDLEVLERVCGRVPGQLFDTQVSAGFVGYSSPSLATLVERVLGVRLQKGDQLTDWMRRPLSKTQLTYAAGDVAHLLELKARLAARLERLGRSAWAAEECGLLLAKSRLDFVPEEAWWRLPHARQLRGAARLAAQEVAAWRERRAERLDLPVRFVASDLAVLSIAQRSPATADELSRLRGVDARHLGGAVSQEILAAVERARGLESESLRLPSSQPIDRPSRPVIALAAAYAAQLAADLHIDPAILATRADLVAFFQDPPQGRLASGWRSGLAGSLLTRLTEGDAALALNGDDRLVLEERSRRPLSGR